MTDASPPETPAPAAIAFENGVRFAQGSLADVATALKQRLARKEHGIVLAFGYTSGAVLDLNLAGDEEQVAARYERVARIQADRETNQTQEGPRGPGRPKLGVVAREVTLLPRHWDWLSAQPGGASVALRRLVEEARKASAGRDAVRLAQQAAYRFMSSIAGNLPNYEDALRALFAGDEPRFKALTAGWPPDVGAFAWRLAAPAFGGDAANGAD